MELRLLEWALYVCVTNLRCVKYQPTRIFMDEFLKLVGVRVGVATFSRIDVTLKSST